MENINVENAKMTQELLEDAEMEIKNGIKLLKEGRDERFIKFHFGRFPVKTLGSKAAQEDLKKLLRLVKQLEIVEVNEEYYIIYRGEEILSVETYKRCTGAYATMLNSRELETKKVFDEYKTLVRALIQALPLILIEEE